MVNRRAMTLPQKVRHKIAANNTPSATHGIFCVQTDIAVEVQHLHTTVNMRQYFLLTAGFKTGKIYRCTYLQPQEVDLGLSGKFQIF